MGEKEEVHHGRAERVSGHIAFLYELEKTQCGTIKKLCLSRSRIGRGENGAEGGVQIVFVSEDRFGGKEYFDRLAFPEDVLNQESKWKVGNASELSPSPPPLPESEEGEEEESGSGDTGKRKDDYWSFASPEEGYDMPWTENARQVRTYSGGDYYRGRDRFMISDKYISVSLPVFDSPMVHFSWKEGEIGERCAYFGIPYSSPNLIEPVKSSSRLLFRVYKRTGHRCANLELEVPGVVEVEMDKSSEAHSFLRGPN